LIFKLYELGKESGLGFRPKRGEEEERIGEGEGDS